VCVEKCVLCVCVCVCGRERERIVCVCVCVHEKVRFWKLLSDDTNPTRIIYWVATVSRIDQIVCRFCRISSLL